MAADTDAACPVAESKSVPNGVPTTTEPEPQNVETPKFDANREATLKNTLALAQQVTSGNHASLVPCDIPADEAVNMAALINSMVRMLNASTVSNKLIVRAAAYMEGEDHLKAGHALRQARSDRRKESYRQPRTQTTSTARRHDDAQALTGLDPNTAVTTNATFNKSSNLQQENIEVESKQQGKQVDSSTQKPKKRGAWQHRRQKRRKSHDAAAASQNAAGGVTVVDRPTESKAPAVSPHQITPVEQQDTQQATTESQGTSNDHASVQATVDNKSGDGEGGQH